MAIAILLISAAALLAGAAAYRCLMRAFDPKGSQAAAREAARERRSALRAEASAARADALGSRVMGALHVSRATAGRTATALRRAGIGAPPGTYYAATLAAAAVGAALGLLVAAYADGAGTLQRVALFAVMAAAGAAAPWAYVRARGKRRLEKIEASLPATLELLAVSVEAGQTVERAVKTVGERGAGPLAEEFGTCAREVTQFGYTVSEALNRMSERVGSRGVTSFCAAATQSIEAGSGIGKVLKSQARMASDEYYLTVEERSNKMPAKIVVVTALFIMPLTFAVTMLPMLISLLDSATGLM